MHYVYVLKSKKTKKLYIGFTSNLRNRLIQHNNSEEKSTKHGVPWKLIYYEAFISRLDALKREKQIKVFKSAYGFLKKRISNSLIDSS